MSVQGSIIRLPENVIAQIVSSVNITSLNGVASELVKNSLDASATKISVSIDYAKGACSVEDDGLGIMPSDFHDDGCLAKAYCSSRHNTHDMVHGKYGTFLASLAAMSLMTITSRHHQFHSNNSLTVSYSRIIARTVPAKSHDHVVHASHGTRVSVRDLFGNMPVRVKQRAIEAADLGSSRRNWEDLGRDVSFLLISWPFPVGITIKNSASNQKIQVRHRPEGRQTPLARDSIDVNNLCTVLFQTKLLNIPDSSAWVTVSASTLMFTIRGAISLTPAPTKRMQFVSLGITPLNNSDGHNELYDEVNRLFANSGFGCDDEYAEVNTEGLQRRAPDEGYNTEGLTGKDLKLTKKGVDRWPMFYLTIIFHKDGETIKPAGTDVDLRQNSFVTAQLLDVLRALIAEFLRKNLFQTRSYQRHRPRKAFPPSSSPAKKINDPPAPSTSSKGDKKTEANVDRGLKRPPDSTPLVLLDTGKSCNNISMPSFKQDIEDTQEATVYGMSRVKCGHAQGPRLYSFGNNSSVEQDHDFPYEQSINRDESTKRNSLSNDWSAANKLQNSRKPPSKVAISTSPIIISKAGKILKKPFGDIPVLPSLLWEENAVRAAPPSSTRISSHNEEEIVWVDPKSKQRCFVNSRTVLTSNRKPSQTGVVGSGMARIFPINLTERTLPSVKHRGSGGVTNSSSKWIDDVLKDWENPVFSLVEPIIPRVSTGVLKSEHLDLLHGHKHGCTQIDIDMAFKEFSTGNLGRISKDDLRKAKVISQVDRKFILIRIPRTSIQDLESPLVENSALVLVDQHAADERCRIEALMKELCAEPVSNATDALNSFPISKISTVQLEKPISFEIPSIEAQILLDQVQHFANWGILYEIHPTREEVNKLREISVKNIPPGIVERCKTEPRLLIDLIRSEVWKCHQGQTNQRKVAVSLKEEQYPHTNKQPDTWLQKIHHCPQGILDMLNSRSCRSAIMFNDELSSEQCNALLVRVAECSFPFQCAHGRPSMIPLVDLGSVGEGLARSLGGQQVDEPDGTFGAAMRRWMSKEKENGEV